MANRFLVGSGAFTSTSIWSATYGGSGGASVPVSGDIIQVDSSYDITSALPSSSSFDFIVYLGNNTASSVTLGLSGSPTFRSLVIQSKNSAAHTVTFGGTVTADKFVTIGSSTSSRLNLGGGTYSAFIITANGTTYGQYVDINGFSANGSPTVPHYIGSGSVDTYSAGSRPWLLQDPPKISTLIDPLTTVPSSNTNWAITGTVVQVTTGHAGGGYNITNDSMVSTNTYDLIDSKIVIQEYDSATTQPGQFSAFLGTSPGRVEIDYKLGNVLVDIGTSISGYPWGPSTFTEISISSLTNKMTQRSSGDGITWSTHDIKTLSDYEMLLFRSIRVSADAGAGWTNANILSINLLPSRNTGAFLQFF